MSGWLEETEDEDGDMENREEEEVWTVAIGAKSYADDTDVGAEDGLEDFDFDLISESGSRSGS